MANTWEKEINKKENRIDYGWRQEGRQQGSHTRKNVNTVHETTSKNIKLSTRKHLYSHVLIHKLPQPHFLSYHSFFTPCRKSTSSARPSDRCIRASAYFHLRINLKLHNVHFSSTRAGRLYLQSVYISFLSLW